MVTKLKLLFLGPQSALILKAVLFGGFLSLARIGELQLVPVLFFIAVASLLYVSPLFHTTRFLVSFAALVFTSLRFLSFLSSALWIWFMIGFSILFYILLGVKNLNFIYRKQWHYLFHLGLLYFLFAIFFLEGTSSLFILHLVEMFLIMTLLFREFFIVNGKGIMLESGLGTSTAGILAFLMTQTLWVVNLLPLGFLNGANLTLLILFVLTDIFLRYFEKRLTRRAILINITLFVLLSLLIFATSKWSV